MQVSNEEVINFVTATRKPSQDAVRLRSAVSCIKLFAKGPLTREDLCVSLEMGGNVISRWVRTLLDEEVIEFVGFKEIHTCGSKPALYDLTDSFKSLFK